MNFHTWKLHSTLNREQKRSRRRRRMCESCLDNWTHRISLKQSNEAYLQIISLNDGKPFSLQLVNLSALSVTKKKKDMINENDQQKRFFLSLSVVRSSSSPPPLSLFLSPLQLRPINWQRNTSRTFVNHPPTSFLHIIFISQYFVTLNPHWTETTNREWKTQRRRKKKGKRRRSRVDEKTLSINQSRQRRVCCLRWR